MNVIASPGPGGGVAIHIPVGQILEDGKLVPVTTDHVVKRLALVDGSFVVLDGTTLPDKYFRNAWDFHPTQGAVINVSKAQDQQRAYWRRLRQPLMDQLDVAYQRAHEQNDAAAMRLVAGQKQALRDVTTSPLPSDPAGIKSTVPAILLA